MTEYQDIFARRWMWEACLINCIERFMELNSAERREMGIRGREKMKSEFDRNKVVKKTMEVINID